MKKIGLLINQRIKNKKQLFLDLERIEKQTNHLSFETKETVEVGGGIICATEFAEDNFDYIIAVGGDGTINEMVNGVLKAKDFKGTLGTLPYGTANDFCKSLPSPLSLSGLVEAVENNAITQVDVGEINYIDMNGSPATRFFVNIADLGMGADVAKRVNNSHKSLGADITFMKAIVQTFFYYRNQPVYINAGNWQWEGKINSVVVANGKYFGSGLCIAPSAYFSDGSFEIVIAGDIRLADYLRHVSQIKRGMPVQHPQVFYKKAKEIKIEGIGKPCGIECDGEFLGTTPVSIMFANRKLNFITTSTG